MSLSRRVVREARIKKGIMEKSLLITISTNLKRMRGAKGISQIKIAKKSGLSRYAYSNIENGKKLPTGGDLQRIADALGVKIQYIVTPVPKIHSLRFRF